MRPQLLGLALSLLCACASTPHKKTQADNRIDRSREIEQERARWEQEKSVERARWTPDMHAAAKTLADATYPSGRAAIEAVVSGAHRRPGNADRDKYRHPIETLEFFGLAPTMTVMEVDPGEGWYTELLAPALASSSRLFATSDTGGAYDEERLLLGERFRGFLDNAPELYGKVRLIAVDSSAPLLGLNGVTLKFVKR